MRELHKAISVVVLCCIALCGILVAASLARTSRLTSQELLDATRLAVDKAIGEAISNGGLREAESHLERIISSVLSSRYRIMADVHIIRFNDFDELAAFHFDVVAGGITARFRLDGIKDPLLAMRLGLDWRWREDPHRPYELHGRSAAMADCLSDHYFHMASDGPDFFARLENKTADQYHHGVETFLVVNGQIAIDHLYLGGQGTIDDPHRETYGLG